MTYFMNHLQGLALHSNYFVTLNPPFELASDAIFAELDYRHPCYKKEVLNTESRLATFNGEQGLFLAGAYTGNGFHEDGVRSATKICSSLGLEL